MQAEEKKNLLSNPNTPKSFTSFNMPSFESDAPVVEPKEKVRNTSGFNSGFIDVDVIQKSGFMPDVESVVDESVPRYNSVRPFMMKKFTTSELHGSLDMSDLDEAHEELKSHVAFNVQEAFNAGHDEGFEQGKTEGFEAGRAEGLEIGKKEGFESAKAEGFNTGTKTADSLLEKFSGLIKEFEGFSDRYIISLEPKVVSLSFAIAKRIIYDELTANPEAIIRLAREALKKITKAGRVTIKISPKLHDLFMEKKAELLTIHPDIVFDIDQTLSKTGFLVTGSEDEICVDIDKMIQDMKEEIAV